MRFVGDCISSFSSGDMVFLGPNLPHVWRNPDAYYAATKTETDVEAICLQFDYDAFGKGFFDIPEMSSIKKLLILSKRGLRILGHAHSEIATCLVEMLESGSFPRLLSLLHVLSVLASTKEVEALTHPSFTYSNYRQAHERMGRVFEYISNNYKNNITLEEVSKQARMSKAGFCKHFKKTTLKTFVQYLNEVKINYASQLLQEDNLTISEICFKTGFNNLSYFNRTFKSITGKTPKEYQKSMTYILKNPSQSL